MAEINPLTIQEQFNQEYNSFGIINNTLVPLTNTSPTSDNGAPSTPNLLSGFTAPVGIQDGQQSAEVSNVNQVIYNGKLGFDNTQTGYRLGVDTDGKAKFYIGNTTKYINWDGTNLSVVGGLSVSSLDIPDVTTANSFHVDTSGNTWWGANVASGLANANASVTSAGTAVFKAVSIGGTSSQYTVNNNGVFSFGDGSDGALVTSGNVTLTSDKYYTNLTISTGDTFNPAGYRIFVNGTLTLNGTGKIARNGNAGGTAVSITDIGGTAGAALANGYLIGSVAGQAGGNGGGLGANGNNGVVGTAVSNSIESSNGSAGGDGGASATQTGGTGGGGGVTTVSNVKLISNWHLFTLLDIGATGSTVKFTSAAGGGSGAGGAGSATKKGGGGGGSGSGGGIIAIYAKNIIIGASALIQANGGNGGNASDGDNAGANPGSGGGGGGSGGNGGTIVLAYNSLTNSGALQVNGGTKGNLGNGGPGTPSGSNGVDGTAGSVGTIYQFQLSL